MPKHSGSDGFQDGIPGICNECFRESPNVDRYYCPHNRRLAVLSEGCWETFRDVETGEITLEEVLTELAQEKASREGIQ